MLDTDVTEPVSIAVDSPLKGGYFRFTPHEKFPSVLPDAAVGVIGTYTTRGDGQPILLGRQSEKSIDLMGNYQRPDEGAFVLVIGNVIDPASSGQTSLDAIFIVDLSEADEGSWKIFMNNLHRYNPAEYTFT
jgi:hypothetical protein